MFLFAEDEQLRDPVAHAVTDRLYNDNKICKGGPVKKKPSNKATMGKRKSKKDFLRTKLTWQIKKM